MARALLYTRYMTNNNSDYATPSYTLSLYVRGIITEAEYRAAMARQRA